MEAHPFPDDPPPEPVLDRRPSAELLEAHHTFPGVYRIKAIGLADEDFEGRVVEAVVAELAARSDLTYSSRATPGGRHVALTLDVNVRDAEQVRTIYARLQEQKGLTMLL